MCLSSVLVHIKKVEIFGFKSFGFKNTTVQFEPGLISISGPNGSGKSNILDAIIFATGETKPSRMRVEKLRSLIHDVGGKIDDGDNASDNGAADGSDKAGGRASATRSSRRGPRMARVALYFDNADRKIPVSSDTVSIIRELDSTGDTTYYLNGKKDARSHIVDLLDVARAGPGNLNVVQQGTITTISEFSPLQKRHAIEDLVGISSFDEKIDAARDQLGQADSKLAIELARMGEIQERIDELDVERNLKMRYDLITTELARYRAISARAEMHRLRHDLEQKRSDLQGVKSETDALQRRLDETNSLVDTLKRERSDVMDAEDQFNHAKADLANRISDSMLLANSASDSLRLSNSRLEQVDKRLGDIASEFKSLEPSLKYIDANLKDANTQLATVTSERTEIEHDLQRVDSTRHAVLKEQSDAAIIRKDADEKINKLYKDREAVSVQLVQAKNQKDAALDKLGEHAGKIGQWQSIASDLEESIGRLDSVIANSTRTISELQQRIETLSAKKSKIASDASDLSSMLETSSDAAARYESKIKTVKGFMHEDYTAAKLNESAESLGIEGLVYEMMSWNSEYERPIMAASSDWIKAMVVKDFDTLITISEAARAQKLPKFKIIPLEAIKDLGTGDTFAPPLVINGVNTIGTLADHVTCKNKKYDALRMFLFGGIVLVGDRDSAISVSKSGYRTVTTSGEYFEARGGPVIVDISSKISRITRLISMSNDVEGLLKSISLLKRYIKKKRRTEQRTSDVISKNLDRINLSQKRLDSANDNRDNLKSRLVPIKDSLQKAPQKTSDLQNTVDLADAKITSCISDLGQIESDMNAVNEQSLSDVQSQIEQRLADANGQKSELESRLATVMQTHTRITSEMSNMTGKRNELNSQATGLEREKSALHDERPELLAKIDTATLQKTSASETMTRLRQEEQDLIQSSGSSMDAIKEYDAKIEEHQATERSLSKDINRLQRFSDTLGREVTGILEREAELRHIASEVSDQDLKSYHNITAMKAATTVDVKQLQNHAVQNMPDGGLKKTADGIYHSGGDSDAEYDNDDLTHNIDYIVRGLEAELSSLVDLNAGAPAKYVEITSGYRQMSMRKNSLESERNSIVQFIERIERDKRQTFLDAFEIVDAEIRRVFNKMTKGQARLELQDEDDIFNSGVSYTLQFPDKPVRDSTSISGGEKTLAAVVFVLGLQKLQPSPFYLFDEVDAHLDAPNAEKLSNILAERARESQFIVVSLKDSVVEKAGLVYGVFPTGGVSNVITYKDRRLSQHVARKSSDLSN